MTSMSVERAARALVAVLCLCAAPAAFAADIGQVKVSRGQVTIEREGRSLPAPVGTRLQAADVVKTGADGSVGITMDDDTLLSAGPNSALSLDRYAFDPTTSKGRFDATLNKGTLAVISGRMAKQAPEAMTLRTPTAILGVRGTEFVVSVND
ncbi:MAG TPA: FecR domain-containing protein [Casimicrobiaceae bacterium]|nr:FecR domain-containing protein [Casimicrobiaceae bacterium]